LKDGIVISTVIYILWINVIYVGVNWDRECDGTEASARKGWNGGWVSMLQRGGRGKAETWVRRKRGKTGMYDPKTVTEAILDDANFYDEHDGRTWQKEEKQKK